jgi:hypothetical protein
MRWWLPTVTPSESEPDAQRAAGIITRGLAAVIDLFVVLLIMSALYGGLVLARLVYSPAAFPRVRWRWACVPSGDGRGSEDRCRTSYSAREWSTRGHRPCDHPVDSWNLAVLASIRAC